jgi:hypothetical protein
MISSIVSFALLCALLYVLHVLYRLRKMATAAVKMAKWTVTLYKIGWKIASWTAPVVRLVCSFSGGFQSLFVLPPLWVLVLPYPIWMLSWLFRPVERLDRLSGVWRNAATLVILGVSFLAVKAAPAWVTIAVLVTLAPRFVHTGWNWFCCTVKVMWALLLLALACASIRETGTLEWFTLGFATSWKVCLFASVAVWGVGHFVLKFAFDLVSITWSLIVGILYNMLTSPVFENLRLVWWAIRNVVVLVLCGAPLAVAKGMVQAVSCLRVVRVRDVGCSVVAPAVPVAACSEATALQPETTVEAAPVLETEAVDAPVVSEVPAKQTRTKPKVPKKGIVQSKPSSRRIRPAPKSQTACPPLRRSKRIAKRAEK